MNEVDLARTLILAHGWNSTCYQILNPGIELWFSRHLSAVIGYVKRGRNFVVAGAPVCDETDLNEVLAEWDQFVADQKGKVCYFGAEGRLRSRLEGKPGYATVVLGAQPEWTPEHFIGRFSESRSMRGQLSRATHKGVLVTEWSAERAENHPELRRLLTEWLAGKGLPSLHFLVESETLSAVMDRRIFVAERAGTPVAFVTLCPIPARNGWLTEQFVRGKDAPNGAIELALFHAIRGVQGSGADFVTMGIVPLSQKGIQTEEANPAWLRLVGAWSRAHGKRFYNFGGLDDFKTKFQPDLWESIVVISKEDRFSPGTLYAIAGAFTRRSPVLALGKGIGKAVRQEMRWLRGRSEKTPALDSTAISK